MSYIPTQPLQFWMARIRRESCCCDSQWQAVDELESQNLKKWYQKAPLTIWSTRMWFFFLNRTMVEVLPWDLRKTNVGYLFCLRFFYHSYSLPEGLQGAEVTTCQRDPRPSSWLGVSKKADCCHLDERCSANPPADLSRPHYKREPIFSTHPCHLFHFRFFWSWYMHLSLKCWFLTVKFKCSLSLPFLCDATVDVIIRS